MNMKCRKCGTENIANAKFCRHCGDSLVMNIMDLYPKLNFIPTNFMDWKKPVVGMIIKRILFIPILLSFALCLYSIWSYNYYNQNGYNHLRWSNDEGYSTRTSDPIFDGMFYEYAQCYKIDGSYYLDAPGKFLQMIFCLERLTEGGNKNEKGFELVGIGF